MEKNEGQVQSPYCEYTTLINETPDILSQSYFVVQVDMNVYFKASSKTKLEGFHVSLLRPLSILSKCCDVIKCLTGKEKEWFSLN